MPHQAVETRKPTAEYSRDLSAADTPFRALIMASPDGMVVVDRSRVVRFANPAAERLLGYQAGQMPGKLFTTAVTPGYAKEVEVCCADDQTRLLEMNTVEIAWAGDLAYLVTLRDVTDRARYTELLRVQLEQERELLELKERFISMVSHEFRTPLTVILSSAELLEAYADRLSSDKRFGHIRRIEDQAKRMSHMLESVLTISRAKAGKLIFSPVPIDLKAFCQHILDDLRANHPTQQLVFNTSGNLDGIYVDETLVQHMLLNLLSNAVKYSPAGGTITLTVARQDSTVLIQISDTGIGIPVDDQKRLFEPFHRGRNTKNIQGTGLGLTIVKNSVEIHGGTIDCDSREGAGTTFTIRLPVTQKARTRSHDSG
ncbi:MAG: PAS domain S-box protein [Anaerolineae bacterium]|nr:PAS domain S-box protein [Anaerolineae bacterium]